MCKVLNVISVVRFQKYCNFLIINYLIIEGPQLIFESLSKHGKAIDK